MMHKALFCVQYCLRTLPGLLTSLAFGLKEVNKPSKVRRQYSEENIIEPQGGSVKLGRKFQRTSPHDGVKLIALAQGACFVRQGPMIAQA
jgi:hypothetical protein